MKKLISILTIALLFLTGSPIASFAYNGDSDTEEPNTDQPQNIELRASDAGETNFLCSFDNGCGATITEITGFSDVDSQKRIAEGATFSVEKDGVPCEVTVDNASVGYSQGVYCVWNISDNVIIHITKHENHDFGNWVTTVKATCVKAGTKERICSFCNYKETASIKAKGHSWSGWKTKVKATCGKQGSEQRSCSTCGKYEYRTTSALTHKWSSWKVAAAATVFKAGNKERTCSNCGLKAKASISKVKPFAKFKQASYSIFVKKSMDMNYCIQMGKGDYVTKWKVNKKRKAKISKSGVLKAKKTGKVKVTATLKSGKKATCTVKIKKAKKKKKSKGKSGVTVYWTPYGTVYHKSSNCPTLSESRVILHGTIKQSGKPRYCKVCRYYFGELK